MDYMFSFSAPLSAPLSVMSSSCRHYADLSCRSVSMLLCNVVGDPMTITQPKSWERGVVFSFSELFTSHASFTFFACSRTECFDFQILCISAASFMRWHLVAGGEVCPLTAGRSFTKSTYVFVLDSVIRLSGQQKVLCSRYLGRNFAGGSRRMSSWPQCHFDAGFC